MEFIAAKQKLLLPCTWGHAQSNWHSNCVTVSLAPDPHRLLIIKGRVWCQTSGGGGHGGGHGSG